MLRQRINYWSCGKFADWVRGSKKPHALTMEEWEEWREKQEKNNNVRYFVADKLLNKIQNIIYFPKDLFYSIKNYLINRFVCKTHYLKTGFKPGYYYEVDEKILHSLFNELVDFVEIELAWMQVISSDKNKYKIPWFRKIKRWRSAEAGLDNLKWACELKFTEEWGLSKDDPNIGNPTPQAESAKQIFEIYNWWKNVRPNRPDPHEISGWSSICSKKKNEVSEQERHKSVLDLEKIEQEYDNEDEEMLIKLIKIRKHLWT